MKPEGITPMELSSGDQLRNWPTLVPFLIAVSAITAILLNAYGMSGGASDVLPHLFYIPIVIAAYFYPRSGVLFAGVLALIYCAMVFGPLPPGSGVPVAAFERSIIFLVIAGIISFLSARIQREAETCQRVTSIVQSTTDAVIAMTPDGIVTDWNGGATATFGYTAREMIGKPIAPIIPPSNPDDIPAFLEKTRRGELIERCETTRLTRDGRTLDVSLSISAIRDMDGHIIGVSMIAHDISEQKRMHDEIMRAKNEWELTFDAVPDLIAIVDSHFRISRVNKAMADRLGLPQDKVPGRICHEVVHKLGEPLGACPHALALGDGKIHSQEIHEDTLHGDFLVTVSPIRDPKGAVTGSVHVMHDITEARHAEEAIHLANKKLNMLSSITRHDILNQVMGLRGYLELSEETEQDPVLLRYIKKEEEVAEAISQQIEFTRYYQDIGVNAPGWHNIEANVRAAAGHLNLDRIVLTIAVGNFEIFADPLIVKVFYNLLENSLRHGAHVTRIDLSAQETATGAVITYCDDGIGIPAEDKSKLFTKGFGKHTGLGLFLTREILSITNITITENGEPGMGVRFEISVLKGGYRYTEGSPEP